MQNRIFPCKDQCLYENLSHFDIVEKVQSFQTGGWENAKKGVYQIKDTFINFWFKFVFPHMSDLYSAETA